MNEFYMTLPERWVLGGFLQEVWPNYYICLGNNWPIVIQAPKSVCTLLLEITFATQKSKMAALNPVWPILYF